MSSTSPSFLTIWLLQRCVNLSHLPFHLNLYLICIRWIAVKGVPLNKFCEQREGSTGHGRTWPMQSPRLRSNRPMQEVLVKLAAR